MWTIWFLHFPHIICVQQMRTRLCMKHFTRTYIYTQAYYIYSCEIYNNLEYITVNLKYSSFLSPSFSSSLPCWCVSITLKLNAKIYGCSTLLLLQYVYLFERIDAFSNCTTNIVLIASLISIIIVFVWKMNNVHSISKCSQHIHMCIYRVALRLNYKWLLLRILTFSIHIFSFVN